LTVIYGRSGQKAENFGRELILRNKWFMRIHGASTCQTAKVLNIFFKARKLDCETDIKVAIKLVTLGAIKTCCSVDFEDGVRVIESVSVKKLGVLPEFF